MSLDSVLPRLSGDLRIVVMPSDNYNLRFLLDDYSCGQSKSTNSNKCINRFIEIGEDFFKVRKPSE